MPCIDDSFIAAKASFVAAVAQAVEMLTTHSGYSRDRATLALLREISRGDDSSDASTLNRPSDEEVSCLMNGVALL